MSDPSRPSVAVIGSINMDLVVRTSHAPAPGETVLGRDLQTIPGGKGANQAVAVARLGLPCWMIGRVGDDEFGQRLLTSLAASKVEVSHIVVTEGTPTGVALIVVDQVGENAICVASGANYRVTPEDVDAAEQAIAAAKVCLLQLELPVDTVVHAIRLCRKHGVETILDPAPAPPNAPDALFEADLITPNQNEAEVLTHERNEKVREAKAAAAALVSRGARKVVLKLAERGALVFDGERFEQIGPHKIAPVDTTAAGDAFTGALAVARARGHNLADAARYANAAGAAACRKFGAQPSMPTPEDVIELLRS
ncbi:MAG TPA: ribokinase [Phycisphaerae bacterium]|nr:ribokinase [Phycisphaerae bacterium]